MSTPQTMELREIGARMGRFLPGFDDPRFHLGSPDAFASQFVKIMDLPMLHREGKLISCAEAFGISPTAVGRVLDKNFEDPASLMAGCVRAANAQTPEEEILEDIRNLLRYPALSFYLQVSELNAFFAALADMAVRQAFRLATQLPGAPAACSWCSYPMARDALFPLKCAACNCYVEAVLSVPMIPAVHAFVSYEMLRNLVALPFIETYQEESEIWTMNGERT
jgi:hypothetical protein